MRLIRFAVVASLLAWLPAAADDLSIACWNVENMFDWHRDDAAPESNSELPSEATVRLKMRKDAEIIKLLKSDIVGLVEVENRNCLRILCEEYLAGEGYEHYTLIDERDPRGIDTAIISKRPFLAHNFAVPGFTRGILTCRFIIDGEPLYLLVNHWKSRRVSVEGEDTESLRIKCARRVVEIVTKIIPEMEGKPAAVLVMGDLNDDSDNKSVKMLFEAGLVDYLARVPADQRWSLPYHDRTNNRVILNHFDHMIGTASLSDKKGIDIVASDVVRPDIMTTKRTIDGKQYTWTDRDFADHIGYSDHFPVRVKLRKVD